MYAQYGRLPVNPFTSSSVARHPSYLRKMSETSINFDGLIASRAVCYQPVFILEQGTTPGRTSDISLFFELSLGTATNFLHADSSYIPWNTFEFFVHPLFK